MLKKIFFILIIGVISVAAASAYTPVIFTFVIDASGSVSDEDFKIANDNIAAAIAILYERSQAYPGQVANQIGFAHFGGQKDYMLTPYFNGSDIVSMNQLFKELLYMRHPKYGNTAIYSAIKYSTLTSLLYEREAGINYANVIILITDGTDNNSSIEDKNIIKDLYPNNDIHLSVIGVGSGARVDEFRGIANQVTKIDDFGALLAAIMVVFEAF